MSYSNEWRSQGGKFALAVGAAGLIFSQILAYFDSSWSTVFAGVGFFLMAVGGASSAFEGLPKLIAGISRHAEPRWDGEALYTDGGRHQVRYVFDARNRPYFVAGDVCNAIGADAPDKDATRWGGMPLLLQGRHLCFSRDAVEAYLTPLGVTNHEANRLTLIRNEVLRKLDRELERSRLSGTDP